MTSIASSAVSIQTSAHSTPSTPPWFGEVPDAEVLTGAQTVAIKVELSKIIPRRLPAILHGLARTYNGIWYFCPKTMQESIQCTLAQLDPAAWGASKTSRRTRSFVLPIAGATNSEGKNVQPGLGQPLVRKAE